MNEKRSHLAQGNFHHRGNRHQYLGRGKFIQHPYRRRNKFHGRPSSHAQQTHPHPQSQPQQETKPTKGNGLNVKELLNIIIKDRLPLSIVKGSNLAYSLQPPLDAQLNASRIRTELHNLYKKKRAEVQGSVNKANNLVLSGELWSSNEKTFYLTVACHLINENWELKSYVLDTAHLLHKNTAENVLDHLLRIAKEWRIAEKIQYVVTNVDGLKKVQNGACSWTYIPCFAFTLEKVFRETLSDWEPLLRKCQQIVAFFHQSDKASQRLQNYCASFKIQQTELTQSPGLQWLPTLYMLKNILKQWRAIFKVFVNGRVDDLDLNENERKIVENIVAVLDILRSTTLEVGIQGFIPISNIIPLVQKLQERLRNQGMMGNKIAEKLSEKCDYHVGSINKILWFRVCTALDPKYKTSVLRDSGIEDIKAEIKRQMREEIHPAEHSRFDRRKSVMQKYWEITGISVNAFEFWKNKEEFKKLASVARKYLTMVSTAIPMERVHHLQESQIIDRRKCLEPENLNMILFLNGNQ